MILAEWMKQEGSLKERLRAVETLAEAVLAPSARTGRGGFLDPGRVEVKADGTCRVREGSSSASEPGYRAPETVGKGSSSPRADVFVVGVLAYELVTGQHPFGGSDPQPESRVASPQSLRPELPDDFCDALMACLERDPEWRAKDTGYLLELSRKVREEVASTVILPASAAPAATVEVVSPPAPKPPEPPAPTLVPPAPEPTLVPRRAEPTLVPAAAVPTLVPAAAMPTLVPAPPTVVPGATPTLVPEKRSAPPAASRPTPAVDVREAARLADAEAAAAATATVREEPVARPPARAASSGGGFPVAAVLGLLALAAAGAGFWWWRNASGPKTETADRGAGVAAESAPLTPATTLTPHVASANLGSVPAAPAAVRATPPAERPAATVPRETIAPTSTAPAAVRSSAPAEPPRAPVHSAPPPTAAPAPVTAPPTTTAAAAPPPVAAPAAPVRAAEEVPAAPAVITNVAPPNLRRSAQVLVDVHGVNLRSEHRVQILRAGQPAPGIAVVRQRYVDPTLLQVLLKVEADVPPGPYQMLIADGRGGRSNVKVFEVAK